MIYLNKDAENQCILELTLNSTLLESHYLFELIKDSDTDNKTYFTGEDLSSFKCRFNRFNIIESGSTYVNLTASTVNLLSGSYLYNIYEASTPTLAISGTTGRIIQTGKAIVNGTDTELPSIYR